MTEVDALPRPRVAAADGLPSRVTIYEVGPRDGLQAEPDTIDTSVKAELCRRLYAAGVRSLEVTSFVPPSWIPQLADAEQVVASLEVPDDARAVALVPNRRGLDRAVESGVHEVAVVASATESFAEANLRSTQAESVQRAADVTAAAAAAGLAVRGYVSMAFGDPWEGAVDEAAVIAPAMRLAEAGCGTIALGDTIGVATPGQVERMITRLREAGLAVDRIALHLHDTYGQALANVLAGLRAGVTELDAAAGGLGRCPYAKGATGNLATEDLVWMLDGLGIETGIDLEAIASTSLWLASERGTRPPSRVMTALAAAGLESAASAQKKEPIA